MSTEAPEGTHQLVGGLEKLMDIWNKISSISGVFDDYTRGRAEMFIQLYLNRNTYWLERDDGNGLLYFTGIQPGLSAFAHIIYWDKRLRGTESLTLKCLLFGVNTFDLKKVNITLPEFSHAARAFAERIGFKQEGRIRNWSIYNGKLCDVYWYGVTREEVLNGAGLLSESGQLQPAAAVPGDNGPAEAVPGSGSTEGGSPGDTVQPSGNERDGGGHIPEPAGHQRVPYQDPENGGD